MSRQDFRLKPEATTCGFRFEAEGAYFASWKMMPSVRRCPRRTRLTPWRSATR
jgi:hypothetical protein